MAVSWCITLLTFPSRNTQRNLIDITTYVLMFGVGSCGFRAISHNGPVNVNLFDFIVVGPRDSEKARRHCTTVNSNDELRVVWSSLRVGTFTALNIVKTFLDTYVTLYEWHPFGSQSLITVLKQLFANCYAPECKFFGLSSLSKPLWLGVVINFAWGLTISRIKCRLMRHV